MSDMTSEAASWREQGLTVTIHRACTKCGAPGVYHDVEWIREKFPACHVETEDPLNGQPVGDRCPNCSASRSPSLKEYLGEIWRRRFVKA